jgi:hypothetical protein
MNTTRSSIPVAEVPGYTELQHEMHDALRAQHPEWIEADGKSPICDHYESRFAELLVSLRAHARSGDAPATRLFPGLAFDMMPPLTKGIRSTP